MSLLPDIPSGRQNTTSSKAKDKLLGAHHNHQNEQAHERISPNHTRTDSDPGYYDYFADVPDNKRHTDHALSLAQPQCSVEKTGLVGSAKRTTVSSDPSFDAADASSSHKEAATSGAGSSATVHSVLKSGDRRAASGSLGTSAGSQSLPALMPIKSMETDHVKVAHTLTPNLCKPTKPDQKAPRSVTPTLRSPLARAKRGNNLSPERTKRGTSEEDEDEEDEICLLSAPYSLAWEEYPSCYFSTSARLLSEEEVQRMNATSCDPDFGMYTLEENSSIIDASSWGDLQPTLEVPRIEDESLGELKEIGVGGDRGSVVYKVARPRLVKRGSIDSFGALKMYPQRISEHEIEFSKLLYNIKAEYEAEVNRSLSPKAVDKKARRSSAPMRRRLSPRTVAQSGVRHLVVPEAIVVANKEERGLLMPLYECSLRTFLHRHGLQYVNRQADNSGMHNERRQGAFLTQPRFEPIAKMDVITAIVFQILCAVDLMNQNMPHTVSGKDVRGYNHNDIHLDNVLIMPNGHIALCDFELVSHHKNDADKPLSSVNFTRLPPLSRQSPHGLFDASADVWATGLVILNLLTGVDPLFSNEVLADDFGNGPLLMAHNSPGRAPGVSVLDWEGNIRRHANDLLDTIDPSCGRRAQAAELLHLCSRCLVNRAGAQPVTAEELLKDPVFASYTLSPESAKRIVQLWISDLNAKSA